MIRKCITFSILVGTAIATWFLNVQFTNVHLDKLSYTFVALSTSYLVFKIILEGAVSKKIRESKARYSFRKTMQLLFLSSALVIIVRIWIVNPQALLVAYGLVAAGVAIALQDVFKNFAGALAIFVTGIYRIGDRIEINKIFGDVIDIGLFYTSLIELRQWVDGDQSTGRITSIPNGQVLSFTLHNYTKDHSFIWDEIALPITYSSDWQKAMDLLQTIVLEETEEATKRAKREISHLEEKYYLSNRNIEPTIFLTPTDNWIMLHIRYVVMVRERRLVRNELSKRILRALQKEEDISIASQTLSITNTTSVVSEN
jgi:small-conductance mechanosensitive channel